MSGNFGHGIGTRGMHPLLRVSLAAAAALVVPLPSGAADVYASTATDGSIRYASQPLDASYTLLFTDSTSAPPAMRTGTKPRPRTHDQHLRPLIDELAARHGMPIALVEAVVAIESGFNPRAVSPKGARGAMQLMPATGRRYGLLNQQQFHSPRENIEAGVRHLKYLLAQHQGTVALALAAYNAGSGAVRRHGNRIPPYPETMLYVPAVLGQAASEQL